MIPSVDGDQILTFREAVLTVKILIDLNHGKSAQTGSSADSRFADFAFFETADMQRPFWAKHLPFLGTYKQVTDSTWRVLLNLLVF
jgi:hypothetical protein